MRGGKGGEFTEEAEVCVEVRRRGQGIGTPRDREGLSPGDHKPKVSHAASLLVSTPYTQKTDQSPTRLLLQRDAPSLKGNPWKLVYPRPRLGLDQVLQVYTVALQLVVRMRVRSLPCRAPSTLFLERKTCRM